MSEERGGGVSGKRDTRTHAVYFTSQLCSLRLFVMLCVDSPLSMTRAMAVSHTCGATGGQVGEHRPTYVTRG